MSGLSSTNRLLYVFVEYIALSTVCFFKRVPSPFAVTTDSKVEKPCWDTMTPGVQALAQNLLETYYILFLCIVAACARAGLLKYA